MGYRPPEGIPVPLVYIPSLEITLAVFATATVIETTEIAVFLKEKGAVDYSAIGNGVNINMTDAGLLPYVQSKYAGDERAFLNAEIMPKLNSDIDAYFKTNYPGWEADSGDIMPSDDAIDAMPSETAQINYKLAKYGSIMVDSVGKKLQVFA